MPGVALGAGREGREVEEGGRAEKAGESARDRVRDRDRDRPRQTDRGRERGLLERNDV